MRPPWSVVIFTTLAGAGQGLFLALVIAEFLSGAPASFFITGAGISLFLLTSGLLASFFHLGHPERAWRSAAMWRTSWLSREVIVLPALMSVVMSWAWAHWSGWPTAGLALIGLVLCLALFVCTAMIYACLKFLQEWHTPLTVFNYTALGCASGLTAAAAVSSLLYQPLVGVFVIAAILVGTAAYAGRLTSLRRNSALRPKSTLATAIGIKALDIRQISQGSMGGSYNTREFFHNRSRATVRFVRWVLLLFVFPIPALLLLLAPSSPTVLFVAFIAQYVGLLAERWYFFAEANHPQNLYYQAIA